MWSGKAYRGGTRDGEARIEGRVCVCVVKLINVVAGAKVAVEE